MLAENLPCNSFVAAPKKKKKKRHDYFETLDRFYKLAVSQPAPIETGHKKHGVLPWSLAKRRAPGIVRPRVSRKYR